MLETKPLYPRGIKEINVPVSHCNELEQLISLAEENGIHPILIAYAYTGMRRGEIPGWNGPDVDFESRWFICKIKENSQGVRKRR